MLAFFDEHLSVCFFTLQQKTTAVVTDLRFGAGRQTGRIFSGKVLSIGTVSVTEKVTGFVEALPFCILIFNIDIPVISTLENQVYLRIVCKIAFTRLHLAQHKAETKYISE